MDNTQKGNDSKSKFIEPREVIAYIRVSTDQQDIGKQRETIMHYSKLAGLEIRWCSVIMTPICCHE